MNRKDIVNDIKTIFINFFRIYKIKQTVPIALGILIFFHVACFTAISQTLEIHDYIIPSSGLSVVEQSERSIPVVDQADVIVAGGGVAGVAAALSAADEGLSVILLEHRNYLGQELTATYHYDITTQAPSPSLSMASKIYTEIARKILVDNNSYEYKEFNKNGKIIGPNELKLYLHKKVAEQPLIKVYFYSMASGVISEEKQIKGVIFTDMNGRQAVLGKAVVDATEDAKISIASGAGLMRKINDAKTARRFVSAPLPESLSLGSMKVNPNLGLKDDLVIIHKGYIELSVAVTIGDDIAYDLSFIQAKTLEKCFALRDYFIQEGIILENFTPSPEIWIDEVPVVACKKQWNKKEVATLSLSDVDLVTPTGISGLIVAGRIVGLDQRLGSLQALLSTGELAGRSAASIASDSGDFPSLTPSSITRLTNSDGIKIKELLNGIEPGKEYGYINQPSEELPVRGKFEVLVVGGGTSGAIAAIAAARQGAHVCIVELLPNLGGVSSNRVNGYYWGVPWKSLLRQDLGGRINLRKSPTMPGGLEKVGFSGEDKKYVLQDLALNAGVKIYYNTLAVGAVLEGDQVNGVVVQNTLGRSILKANIIIDATGQAGIAAAAGAGFMLGRETDGFVLEIERGPLRDPTNSRDISEIYLNSPSWAASLNIRESRRIIGDYIVTFDDAIHERLYPDVISRWRSNYDTHFPTSANLSDIAQDWVGILGLWRRPIMGSIPYRSLLPKDLENILVVGKAYSVDHDAVISGRMQPDMEHLGEAAGIAAAMACELKLSARDVPVQKLQRKLVKSGVLRDKDVPNQFISEGPSEDVLHSQDFWREERELQFPTNAIEKRVSLKELSKQLGTDNALEAMVKLYLEGEKSIVWLQPLVNSDNQKIREEAAVLLGLLGDRSAIPSLLEFLKERNVRRFEYKLPNASSRASTPLYWTSAILLGRFHEKQAVPLMLDILSSSPPPEELGMFNRATYGDDMFENTSSCPPPLVSFIIVALGRIGDPVAIDYIRPYLVVSNPVNILKDENKDFEIAWGIQTNAAWALAQMGDKSGVPVLINLLDAKQAQLRKYARHLLEEITGVYLGTDSKVWNEWWEKNR